MAILKCYGTHTCIPNEYEQYLESIGGRFNHSQFRVVCKAKSMAEANGICENFGFQAKTFLSNYTSETGNEKELKMLEKTNLIISKHGTCSNEYLTIEEIINGIKK